MGAVVSLLTTVDSVLDGAVVLEQPAQGHGYRFNVDAVLLARFAVHGRGAFSHLVDLGAGVGAVAFCAGKLASIKALTLVDDDAAACALARRNADRAGLADHVRVVECDVSRVQSADIGPADIVVMNPPYTPDRAGRVSPVQARDRSRRGSVVPFVQAAARLLSGSDSRLCACYPARSLVQLLQAIDSAGLHARRGAMVHPSESKPARIALIEASTQSGEFRLEPPVFG
ncbi:MAG: methyltransferase [Deltaproteobacteria bacterium]|nr:methyltransferase [Deltaproteobacteria bacterium]